MEKILSVEDDVELSKIIRLMLQNKGYEVVSALSVKEAMEAMDKNSFDLILLDMMLSDGEGTQLCEEIRNKSFCPIIFVSCISDKETKLKALEIGGDDYITKPIDFNDLFMRIQVNIRRANQYNLGKSFSLEEKIGDLIIKKQKHEVWAVAQEDTMIMLSPLEYGLLMCFIDNQDELLLYSDLYKSVWNADDAGDFRTVMVHVSNLRKKLKDKGIDYIHTVRSAGYIFSVKY